MLSQIRTNGLKIIKIIIAIPPLATLERKNLTRINVFKSPSFRINAIVNVIEHDDSRACHTILEDDQAIMRALPSNTIAIRFCNGKSLPLFHGRFPYRKTFDNNTITF